jgi:tetratricopeptide (TPR) repeat protein
LRNLREKNIFQIMAKKPLPGKASQRPIQRPQPKPQAKTPAAAAKSERLEPTGWLKFALAALIITALCYLPSLSNNFVNWDDPANITENPNLQRINEDGLFKAIPDIFDIKKGAVIGNYNPLPILTFAIEKKLAGGFTPEFTKLVHADNLIFHLLTVFFATLLLLRMGIGNWGALVGGLLFGIHPMRVESVAWATERKDVLFGLFFFAALVCYVKWLKQGERGENRTSTYLIMLILAVVACFGKVQAVTLPLAMLALDYWFRRPPKSMLWLAAGGVVVLVVAALANSMGIKPLVYVSGAILAGLGIWSLIKYKVVQEKIPFIVISLIFGAINIYTLGAQGSTTDQATKFDFLDRLSIGAYSFCVYLYKLVAPHPMSPLYPYQNPLPKEMYFAAIPFLAIWAGIWWLWRNDRRVGVFGAMFFFFNVAFLLQVFGAGQGFKADRFSYVAYFGFFAVAAWFFDKYFSQEKTKIFAGALAGVFLLASAVLTVRQIGIWKNGETLWAHVIKYEGKTNSLPYWNRGQYFRQIGNYDRALQDYSQAVGIEPNNSELYNSRGKTYFDMAMSGKFNAQRQDLVQKALKDYTDALALPNIKPKSKSEILINRGAAHGSQNNFAQSIQDLSEGLKIDSTNENGYFNRSIAYYSMGQIDNSLADYNTYLRLNPYNAEVLYESGMILRAKGQTKEAIERLSRAIQLKPSLGLAYLERARAYMQIGNRSAAQQDYRRAQQFGIKLAETDVQMMGGQ